MQGWFKNYQTEQYEEGWLHEKEAIKQEQKLQMLDSDDYKRMIALDLIKTYQRIGIRDDPMSAFVDNKRNKGGFESREHALKDSFSDPVARTYNPIEAKERYVLMTETEGLQKAIANNETHYRGIPLKERKKEEYKPFEPYYPPRFWDFTDKAKEKIYEAVTDKAPKTKSGDWCGGTNANTGSTQLSKNFIELDASQYGVVESKKQEPTFLQVFKGVFKW